jgi:hypothetical protein
MVRLPFLTAVDPLISGEGILDPLGLSNVADRLAEDVLPGLRARMARPRFLTLTAVAAAVCEGLPDVGEDGVTPPHIAFEWLVVEAFVRAADRRDFVNTPGTLKAQAAKQSGDSLRASTYLRAPGVFGFHGVYKPIATDVGVVDDDFHLGDAGYALIRIWEDEQGLPGFLPRAGGDGTGRRLFESIHVAISDALKAQQVARSGGWAGWREIATHLVPAGLGSREAEHIKKLMGGEGGGTRGEVFATLHEHGPEDSVDDESRLVAQFVRPHLTQAGNPELVAKLDTIDAFEAFATAIETAFDRLLHASSVRADRPVTASDLQGDPDFARIAGDLAALVDAADRAMDTGSIGARQEFEPLSQAFRSVRTSAQLFEALLSQHATVQKSKAPDGKREWLEHDVGGGVYVRPLYRVDDLRPRPIWGRPYRFHTVHSFSLDLRRGLSRK